MDSRFRCGSRSISYPGSGWCGVRGHPPRFGAGVKTAVIAGLAVLVLRRAAARDRRIADGVHAQQLMVIGTCVALIALPVATVAGAYVYKEV